VLGDLAEILGEQAPDALQEEVSEDIGIGRATVAQLLVQIDEMDDRLTRERRLAAGEDRFATGQEEQRVVLIGQVDQVEHDARRPGIRAGLPDLQPAEGAEDDIGWSGCVRLGVGRLAPVREGLLAVRGEPLCLRRRLHLDHAHARPHEINEPTCLVLLEVRNRRTICPVAGEKLVQVGLGL